MASDQEAAGAGATPRATASASASSASTSASSAATASASASSAATASASASSAATAAASPSSASTAAASPSSAATASASASSTATASASASSAATAAASPSSASTAAASPSSAATASASGSSGESSVIAKYRRVWDSVPELAKRKFLKIGVADLKDFCSKHQDITSVIDEAVRNFSEKNKWEVLLCPKCEQSITSEGLQHLLKNHTKAGPMRKLDDYDFVHDYWLGIVKDGIWKPIDMQLALPMMTKGLKSNCSTQEIMDRNWPVYEPPVILKLLSDIRASFLVLITDRGCLTRSQIEWVTTYAMENLGLHRRLSGQVLKKMCQVNIPIRCLGKEPLEFLLGKLEEFYDESGSLGSLPAEIRQCEKALIWASKQEKETMEEILGMDEERSSFLLLHPLSNQSSSEVFFRWMMLFGDEPKKWGIHNGKKVILVDSILSGYETMMNLIQTWTKEQEDFPAVQEIFKSLDSIFAEEIGMRQQGPRRYKANSFLRLLKKRQEELLLYVGGGGGEKMAQVELTVIKQVLEQLGGAASRNKDILKIDDLVVKSLLKYKHNESTKWMTLESRIMRIYSYTISVVRRFSNLPGLDPRFILIPMIKCYLQEKLETLSPKEETDEDSDFNTQLLEITQQLKSYQVSTQGNKYLSETLFKLLPRQ